MSVSRFTPSFYSYQEFNGFDAVVSFQDIAHAFFIYDVWLKSL